MTPFLQEPRIAFVKPRDYLNVLRIIFGEKKTDQARRLGITVVDLVLWEKGERDKPTLSREHLQRAYNLPPCALPNYREEFFRKAS